jgi:hypothetical protein
MKTINIRKILKVVSSVLNLVPISDVELSNSITLPLEITLSGGTTAQVRINNITLTTAQSTIIVYPITGPIGVISSPYQTSHNTNPVFIDK